jgi:DNA-binding CsgD family transcriptional regulator
VQSPLPKEVAQFAKKLALLRIFTGTTAWMIATMENIPATSSRAPFRVCDASQVFWPNNVRRNCVPPLTDVSTHDLPRPEQAQPSQQRTLTAREQEVLKLLAEGKTVRAAAMTLGLSSKTVDCHKFNLMRKLGIHKRAELVMWAIQKRVVKISAAP